MSTAPRRIHGTIRLPDSAGVAGDGRVRVEVRDVSLADARSRVVASRVWDAVPLSPGARLPYEVLAPEAPASSTWALRVQIDGRDGVMAFLTTAHWPVANRGDCELDVMVQRV